MNDDAPNALELALEKAATGPAHRPEFYRVLLQSEVFVLGQTERKEQGAITVEEGETLSIAHWRKNDGTNFIPVFTSLAVLRRAISGDQSYLALSARTLFEATKGANVILNPASSFGKEFLPNEIESLLATGLAQAPETRVVEKATKVLLGQPADYPTEMVAALRALFAKHPAVKSAYLCLMSEPSAESKPSLVVGVQGDAEIERAIREAGSVVAGLVSKDRPVDFIRIVPGEDSLGAHFIESVRPFYRRSWGAKLKAVFATGG